ncbi:hypothetical protein [Bartonella sp. ML70XJBT]|uniref:hypothetical protein n=1 Tax=Bartonella sp. ML70XJBT TaxID=3019096 RepID=UPI00235F887E
MNASFIIGWLIGAGTTIFICGACFLVLFSTAKIVLALYYSLIKRTILLLKRRWKLNKSPAQNLRHDQTERRGQTALATQLSALSFKESLELSREESRILFLITFVMLVLFVGFIVFAAFLPKSAIFLHNHTSILLYVIDFVMGLLFWVWSYIVVALPIILILYSLLQCGVEKTVKKLEIFA